MLNPGSPTSLQMKFSRADWYFVLLPISRRLVPGKFEKVDVKWIFVARLPGIFLHSLQIDVFLTSEHFSCLRKNRKLIILRCTLFCVFGFWGRLQISLALLGWAVIFEACGGWLSPISLGVLIFPLSKSCQHASQYTWEEIWKSRVFESVGSHEVGLGTPAHFPKGYSKIQTWVLRRKAVTLS